MAHPFPLPRFAAWRHCGVRERFEVVFFEAGHGILLVEGHTAAVEDEEPFAVRYAIELDDRWQTRSVQVSGQSSSGAPSVVLESDGGGKWLVDGRAAPHLDGCLDVDLESSSLTNAFPVHRLCLEPGDSADAPAAYVRALSLDVERLEQRYVRLDRGTGRQRYDYTSPSLNFRAELVFDEAGLVLDYPGLAIRAATTCRAL